jgi:hypothetical protein
MPFTMNMMKTSPENLPNFCPVFCRFPMYFHVLLRIFGTLRSQEENR